MERKSERLQQGERRFSKQAWNAVAEARQGFFATILRLPLLWPLSSFLVLAVVPSILSFAVASSAA
jgi:hypothetical protein